MRLGDFWRVPLRTRGLPGRVNSYIIGHREIVLVDPGSDFRGELDRLRRCVWELLGRGGELRMVLLTHHHPDHVAGALRLSDELGAPIAGHAATLDTLASGRRRPWLLPLEDGARLELAPSIELEVLHTPGHARGHLCLFEPRRRVLLSGDIVLGRGTTFVDAREGGMTSYLASLERLAALEPELLLPGHGPARSDAAQVIRQLIAHRLWREEAIVAALDAVPRSRAEIARRAHADLPPLKLPLAYRSTLAHLHKLEAEGRAVRCGNDCWVRRG